MSDKEILYKATRKAIENGWNAPFSIREVFDAWWEKNRSHYRYFSLIYDHDFAKALFGKRIKCRSRGCTYECDDNDTWFEHAAMSDCYSNTEMWSHWLRLMVCSGKPFEYMQHFLEINKDESEV